MLKYDTDFAIPVVAAGLVPRKCDNNHEHWQIKGGIKHALVNCWPNTKRGFRHQVWNGKVATGTIQGAINLAGPPEKPAAGLAEIAPFDMSDDPEEKLPTGLEQLAKEIVAGFDRDLAAKIPGARERQVGFIRWLCRKRFVLWLWRKIW